MEDDRPRGHNGRKNRRIDLFIAALLTHCTVEEAAAAAKISSASSWRYLRDAEVLTRLREACRHSMRQSQALLQAASIESVQCLRKIVCDGESQSVQVAAARTLLEIGLKAVELADIEERLAKLEKAIARRSEDDHQPDSAQVGATRRTNGRA